MRFLLGRVFAAAVTLLLTSFIIFGGMFLAPGDPAVFLLRGRSATPEALEAIRQQFGLDRSFLEQYLSWFTGVLRGDFGSSLQSRQSVLQMLLDRLPNTALLIGFALLLSTVFGIIFGTVAARTRHPLVGRTIGVLTTGAAAVPAFVAGMVLMAIFSVQLGWFPTFGAGSGFLDRLHHLFLPAVSLAIAYTAVITRVTRNTVLMESQREFVEIAVARKTPPARILFRHILRNSWAPIATVVGVVIMVLCVVTVYVENIFQLNGIGALLIDSVLKRDFPVVQAIVMMLVVFFIFVNIIVDLVQLALDPRIRAGVAVR